MQEGCCALRAASAVMQVKSLRARGIQMHRSPHEAGFVCILAERVTAKRASNGVRAMGNASQ